MKQYKYIGESDELTTNGKIYNVKANGTFIDDTNKECCLGNDYQKYFKIVSIKNEVSKEDLTIGFSEWLRNECYDTGLKWYYQKDNEEYTSTELLEIYKKEKGL